ncbi:replication-relaxation family protein [Paenibacillus sp. NPDC056579]|uniref:replication-relaxation family protein n=1 Tax=Paenibacillus sp. NPDC056579 TaxID=3345871 RepID=UPI0036955A5D
MEVSPIIKSQYTGIKERPLLDDPHAYIQNLDPLTKHDYSYILKKIEQGWITERDLEILKFIFVHRWLTLSQISRIFFPDVEREATARNRVKKLIKHGLVRRIQWTSYFNPQENRPSCYELGSSGADILKYKFGFFLGSRDPRAKKETTMLYRMRYIATNEFYIKLQQGLELIHFEFHPSLSLEDEKQVPTARYILKTPKGKDLNFYFICHRDDDNWLKTVRYQAAFYKQYFKLEEPGSVLVMMLSTFQKAEIVHKILEQEGMANHAWFVTDEDLYNNQMHISQSFFIFHEGRRVYYDLR